MSQETTRGGWALGRLGVPEVGLGGEGGTEEDVWGKEPGAPHEVTGQKRSYESSGSPGR